MRHILYRTVLVAVFLVSVLGVGCGGDDDGGDTCDFELTVSISAQPTYTFTDGDASAISVVRQSDRSKIVWGIFANPPESSSIASPLVHGTVPTGSSTSALAEPSLSSGIGYRVIVAKTSGAECADNFTP